MRKAITLLQSAAEYSDRSLTAALVAEISGVIPTRYFDKLQTILHEKNFKEVQLYCDEITYEGYAVDNFFSQVGLFILLSITSNPFTIGAGYPLEGRFPVRSEEGTGCYETCRSWTEVTGRRQATLTAALPAVRSIHYLQTRQGRCRCIELRPIRADTMRHHLSNSEKLLATPFTFTTQLLCDLEQMKRPIAS